MFHFVDIRKMLLILSWISIFAMLWLMLFNVLPRTSWYPWGFLGIFAMIAIGSSESKR